MLKYLCASERSNRLVAWIAAAVAVFAWGCASGPTAKKGVIEQDGTRIDLQMDPAVQPWVLHGDAGAVLKLQPSGFERVRPFVEAFVELPKKEGDAGQEGGTDASGQGADELLGYLDRLSGGRLPVEKLDAGRSIWVVLEPRVDHPRQICQDVGLPCSYFGAPKPRFVRVFLPAEDAQGLAEKLTEMGPDDRFRARPLAEQSGADGEWVHAQFGIGGDGAKLDWSAWFDRRFERPAAGRVGRLTPAKVATLNAEGPAAAWMDLRAMLDLGIWQGLRDVNQVVHSVDAGRRSEVIAAGELLAHQIMALNHASSVEFEDVAVRLGGDGEGGMHLDALLTRTPYGQKIARAGGGAVDMSAPGLEEPGFGLSVAYDVAAARQAVGEKPLSVKRTVDVLRDAGLWGYVAALRLPTALAKNSAAGMGGTRLVPDLHGFRLVGDYTGGVPGRPPVNAGVALLARDGKLGDTLFEQLKRQASRISWLHTDSVQRGDERIEYRASVGVPMDTAFPDDAGTSSVEAMDVQIQGGTAVDLLQKASGMMGPMGWQLRMMMKRFSVPSTLSEMVITLRGATSDRLSATRLAVGSGTAADPEVADAGLSLRQPDKRCLVALGDRVRDVVRDAKASADFEAHLLEALDGMRDDYADEVRRCVEAGDTSSRHGHWAVGNFEAVRAVLESRRGNREAAEKLLERACKRKVKWACDSPDFDAWPWADVAG